MVQVRTILAEVSAVTAEDASNAQLSESLLQRIAAALEYTVVGKQFHQFSPQGLTGVLLLSESHIAIHTWPEERYVVIELLSCKPIAPTDEEKISSLIRETYQNCQLQIKKL
jgi:S-adenosylmethionine decarboxylase